MQEQEKNIVILIPSYNPNEKLVELVRKLKKEYATILVIDDGSSEETKKIFQKIEKEVVLLVHENNQGKGNALKTGFSYFLEQYRHMYGLVTVDADGQHNIDDIQKVAQKLIEKRKVVFGIRNFKKGTPLKNKIGNRLMSLFVQMKTGKKIEDTQTGLRAIPTEYIKPFLTIKGERFEYEMNVLLYIVKQNIPFEKVAIQTIYEDEKSNFHVWEDSKRVMECLKQEKD